MTDFACDRAGHCVTCADEAVPMRVVEAADGLALCVDGDGARAEVMTDLVGDIGPGDEVLVHAGAALVLVEPAEARR